MPKNGENRERLGLGAEDKVGVTPRFDIKSERPNSSCDLHRGKFEISNSVLICYFFKMLRSGSLNCRGAAKEPMAHAVNPNKSGQCVTSKRVRICTVKKRISENQTAE